MKRIIAIACMLVLLAPMPALAADLVIDAPSTVLVSEPFVITVTANGSPVAEATVICSLGGAQHYLEQTNVSGMTTFTPTTTGDLLITAVKSGHADGNKTITVVASTVTGDLNGDGALTTADAAIALQMAVGARTPTTAADVSGDGVVTSLDALMILQAAAGSIEL